MRLGWLGVITVYLGCAIAQAQAPPREIAETNTRESREKLHHCAAEWTRMKRSGEASGRLWRDFWEGCGKK